MPRIESVPAFERIQVPCEETEKIIQSLQEKQVEQ
jgi:hypothetical protein